MPWEAARVAPELSSPLGAAMMRVPQDQLLLSLAAPLGALRHDWWRGPEELSPEAETVDVGLTRIWAGTPARLHPGEPGALGEAAPV